MSSLPDETQTEISSDGDIFITAKGGIIAQSASINNSNDKDIVITSSEAGVDLSTPDAPQAEISSEQGNIYITAKNDISITSAKITASTGWGMELEFVATGSDSKLWVNDATVEGKSITAQNLTINGSTTSGTITLVP